MNEELRTKNPERDRDSPGPSRAAAAALRRSCRALPGSAHLFLALRFSFFVLSSSFFVLGSSFFVLGSSFFVLRSSFVILSAQRNQPVYPVYDGFLKNADGSYTLSFAYFSHNAEVVTILPGAANAFAPEPGDRQQPTVFKPGHWRFQCVMVVGPDFDGKMKWNLTYAGTTTGTSERMLQSNWNLLEGAADLGRIDFAKVPRGVCLNRPPVVRLLGKTARKGEVTIEASTTEALNLFGSANDEGLPRSKPFVVGWKVIKGPGTVSFSQPNAARTKANFSAPGTYELELSATDSEFTSTLKVIASVK